MIRKGILKSFDSSTHQSTVQIVGSLTNWLADVPTSHALKASDMIAGRYVAVLTPDEKKPGESVVVDLWTEDTAPDVPAAGAYLGSHQYVGHNIQAIACLDTEVFDKRGEFDSAVKTGTADATEANKLHDADGGFTSSDVGAQVWNTTDNTYAKVTAFVDSGELTLDTDIMVNGEGYKLYHARYVVTEPGLYLVAAAVCYLYTDVLADKNHWAVIKQNGTLVSGCTIHSAIAGYGISPFVLAVLDLAADDYIQLIILHYAGTAIRARSGQTLTWMYVVKLA